MTVQVELRLLMSLWVMIIIRAVQNTAAVHIGKNSLQIASHHCALSFKSAAENGAVKCLCLNINGMVFTIQTECLLRGADWMFKWNSGELGRKKAVWWAEWRWDAFLSEHFRFSCRCHSARAPLSYQKDKRSKCWDLQKCASGKRGALGRKILEAYRLVHTIRCSYVHLPPYLTHCSLRLMVSAWLQEGVLQRADSSLRFRDDKADLEMYMQLLPGQPENQSWAVEMHVHRAPCFTVLHVKSSLCCFQCTIDILPFYIAWLHGHFNLHDKVKVKITLEQATKAHRGSRGIALLFV